MSNISKPGIYFEGAVAPHDTELIPAEYIWNMSKLNETASALNNNTAAYYIVLAPINPLSTGTRTYKIPFSTEAKRDFSYTKAKTFLAATIGATA